MLKNLAFTTLSLLFLVSCGGGMIGGQYQENLKRLDEVHGYCDNPVRNIKKGSLRYKICKDKEMAAGADGIVDDELNLPFQDLLNRDRENKGTFALTYNRFLWEASLDAVSDYPLRNIDSQGGYLETEYIYEEGLTDKRCIIKIKITSTELISTGVSTNIICQNKIEDGWVGDKKPYTNESKQLTLLILNKANQISQQDQ